MRKRGNVCGVLQSSVQIFADSAVEPDHLGHAESGAIVALQGRLIKVRIPFTFYGPTDEQGALTVDDPVSRNRAMPNRPALLRVKIGPKSRTQMSN